MYHAIFLLCHQQDLHTASILLGRASRLEYYFDIEFLIFSADKVRQKYMEIMDGGTEEITFKIKIARMHQEECKKYIRTFWHNLLTELDLGTINDVIARIDKHERSADESYKKLLKKWPKSVTILRAYAVFLGEVKNDQELAHITFGMANEIEEERSKKLTKQNNKKKKV